MTRNRKERPGVMLYFDDIRPAINRLDPAQSGALLRSVVDYAQYGVVPELDPMTSLVFDMLVPKIDRDAARYEESREQRLYAVYTREKRKNGDTPLSFAEWRLTQPKASEPENIGPISPDHENIGPYPSASATTTATASTSASASPSASASANTSPSPAAAGEGFKGEGEVRRLYEQWLRAMDARDSVRAMELDGRLFALGYKPDIHTRKLRKRSIPGSMPAGSG